MVRNFKPLSDVTSPGQRDKQLLQVLYSGLLHHHHHYCCQKRFDSELPSSGCVAHLRQSKGLLERCGQGRLRRMKWTYLFSYINGDKMSHYVALMLCFPCLFFLTP